LGLRIELRRRGICRSRGGPSHTAAVERWSDGLGSLDVLLAGVPGAGVWTRPDSRLLIIRCGKTFIERLDDVVPDTYYFVWEDSQFKLVAHKKADTTPPPY